MEAPHDSSVSPRGLQEVPEVTLSQLSSPVMEISSQMGLLLLRYHWLLSALKKPMASCIFTYAKHLEVYSGLSQARLWGIQIMPVFLSYP